MSYDEKLSARVRTALARRRGVTEKKMFGGVCFLVNGAMCCGVLGTELIARVGSEHHADAVADKHARPFDFTGRPSKGMVYVSAAGIRTAAQLQRWLDRGLAEARAKAKKRG